MNMKKGNLEIEVFDTRHEMGEKAASDITKAMKAALSQKKK